MSEAQSMNQKEKIKKVEELFDEIKTLFPSSSISLMMHNIDLKNLPSNWRVKKSVSQKEGDDNIYRTAERIQGSAFFDITLFE